MSLPGLSIPTSTHSPSRNWIAGQVCPLCGDPGIPYSTPAFRDDLLRACACGTLLSWQWASEEALQGWYESMDYHGDQQAAEGLPDTRRRDQEHARAAVSRLKLMHAQGLHPSTLFDVGAGMGSFVAAATAAGFDASGIEPSNVMVEEAVALGRNIKLGDWRSVLDGRFWPSAAVVTCFDVIEHLTRPEEALKAMAGCLGAGGTLLIEMPEYLSPFGDWTRHFRPMQHVCLYTEGAAREIISRAGLKVRHVTRPSGPGGRPLGKAVYWAQRAGSK